MYVLLGGELYHELFIPEIRKGSPGVPVAQNTSLGWIIIGRLDRSNNSTPVNKPCQMSVNLVTEIDIDNQLKKFWEIEEIPNVNVQ